MVSQAQKEKLQRFDRRLRFVPSRRFPGAYAILYEWEGVREIVLDNVVDLDRRHLKKLHEAALHRRDVWLDRYYDELFPDEDESIEERRIKQHIEDLEEGLDRAFDETRIQMEKTGSKYR